MWVVFYFCLFTPLSMWIWENEKFQNNDIKWTFPLKSNSKKIKNETLNGVLISMAQFSFIPWMCIFLLENTWHTIPLFCLLFLPSFISLNTGLVFFLVQCLYHISIHYGSKSSLKYIFINAAESGYCDLAGPW